MPMSTIIHADPEVAKIISGEKMRQLSGLEMIASENYVTKPVLEAMGSIFTNKYSEGYPGKRYYGGQEWTDEIEILAQKRALEIFGLNPDEWQVNLQPYSGSPANIAVYFALAEFGDTLMGMSLNQGGHLTHGHKVNFSGKAYNFVQYSVQEDSHLIDYQEVSKLAKTHKPKIIISGATAYPRKIDFEKFGKIAKEVGAIHMADISHVAGLIVAGQHPSPFPHADVVTTTTHKTLRGPRGAMIFARKEYGPAIDKAIFPGLQGGPHMHIIAAKAVAFKEASEKSFKDYGKQVIKNMQAFAEEAIKLGFSLITKGTDNHLVLIDLRSKDLTGQDFEKSLGKADITVNKNSIPFDPLPPAVTSGVRVGSAALTTRGLREEEMRRIAGFFAEIANQPNDDRNLRRVKNKVHELTKDFSIPGINA